MHLTKRHVAVVATLASVLVLPTARAWAQDDQTTYQPVTSFDPQRSSFADLKQAIDEAGRTQRRIMLEVGNQSCLECKNLDQLFASNQTLKDLRDTNYVWLKINSSRDNENKQFLAQYPAISDYPHFFVLAADGHLVHSQDTKPLEEAKGYSPDRMKEFLNRWGPPREIDSPLQ
jgi:thiol:disulfide interchange protein